MPQFDTTFFESQIFWTIISFAILFYALNRWILPIIKDILEQRRVLIAQSMVEAEDARVEAESIKARYEQELNQIAVKAADIIKEAEKKAGNIESERLSALEQELRKRKQQFLADEAFLRAQSIKEIRKDAVDLIITATEQLIHEKMSQADAEKILAEVIHTIEKEESSVAASK